MDDLLDQKAELKHCHKGGRIRPPQATATCATCPSCRGTGTILRPSASGAQHKQICLACKATGQVDVRRICSECGEWLATCICERSKDIRTFKRQQAISMPVQMGSMQGDEASAKKAGEGRPKQPRCPWGFCKAGCNLKRSCWLQAWLCVRCGHFEE